jgi:hypothetical protein
VTQDDSRVDLVFGAVAIDGGSRRLGDDRAGAVAHRPPDETVDERILERRQRVTPVPGEVE